jgi:hypothetical protein
MASTSFRLWRLAAHVAVVCLVSGLELKQSEQAFLQKTSRHVSEPGAVDGSFFGAIADAPGDVLVLLHSPTCPDCEWLMEKVWKTVASKLAYDNSISVMTMSDPGFAAPKPFEHWNNPAIFWCAKDHKMQPVFFPQARLQEYLAGIPARPQGQQDLDFAEDLLVFAKGAVGVNLFSRPTAPVAQGRAEYDTDAVADKGWAVLQGKWAVARQAAGGNPNLIPAYAQAAVPAQQAAYPAVPAQQALPAMPTQLYPALPAQQAAFPGLPAQQAFPSFEQAYAPIQSQPVYASTPAQPVYAPKASLVSSGQTLVQNQALKLATDYTEQFLRTHTGQGYTQEGVYNYAIQYYQGHPR